ncbi:hypothetical protein Hanom_Chr09g00815181 [Helianthus anomalus]
MFLWFCSRITKTGLNPLRQNDIFPLESDRRNWHYIDVQTVFGYKPLLVGRT